MPPTLFQLRRLLLGLIVLPSLLAWGQLPAQFMNVCSEKHPSSMGHCASPPRLKYAADPHYSEKARRAGYEGTVVLWLIVDTKGMPQDIRVAKAIGMSLDSAALNAVQQWRFEPATYEGKSVPVQINVEVNFRLTRNTSAAKNPDQR